MEKKMAEPDKLTLIATIAASYLRRNSVGVDQIATVMSSVTEALEQASKKLAGITADEGEQPAAVEEKQRPAVPVKKSVQPEYIVCLEDGQHQRTLKRHLQSAHGLTPKEYREKWRLPKDYPMVAPAYSEQRSKMAKALGLGRKIARPTPAGSKRRGRKPSGTNGNARPA
jgi:predicted transcriptional regulator